MQSAMQRIWLRSPVFALLPARYWTLLRLATLMKQKPSLLSLARLSIRLLQTMYIIRMLQTVRSLV